MKPKLSAYAYMHGNFDYNKTPLVPMGMKVVAHSKPDSRETWAFNGEEGWTIGPSVDHYCHIKVFFPNTRSEHNVDTVTFFPHNFKIPQVSLDDFLRQAVNDIITLLTIPPDSTTPSLEAGDSTRNALLKLADILKTSQKLPTLPKDCPTTISTPSQSSDNQKYNKSKLTDTIGEPRVNKSESQPITGEPRVFNETPSSTTSTSTSTFERKAIKHRKL